MKIKGQQGRFGKSGENSNSPQWWKNNRNFNIGLNGFNECNGYENNGQIYRDHKDPRGLLVIVTDSIGYDD